MLDSETELESCEIAVDEKFSPVELLEEDKLSRGTIVSSSPVLLDEDC